MPLLADRVKESTSTTGTGTLTLLGAYEGYQTFTNAFGNGVAVYYAIAGGDEWEVGIGTTGAGTLTRSSVLASSNGGALVPFSVGVKDVFCTYAAGRAVTTSDAATLTNKTIDDYSNFVGANQLHFKIKANETIVRGDVLKVVGYNAGEGAVEVLKVSAASDVAVGLSDNNLAIGEFGTCVNTGAIFDINTNSFAVGTILYPNTSGGLTSTKPSSGTYQAIAFVLRQQQNNGVLLVEASKPNYVETSTNTGNTLVLRDASGNFSAGTITASLSGTATTATTATNVAWSGVTSTPTTISGYGITDGVTTGGSYSNPSWITSLAWSKISSTPTTLSGYGITDGVSTGGSYANPTWITSLAGSKISGNITGNAANVTGTIAIANGGTGATDAATARSNLSVPSTTGSGASGTWSINISGNAATATSATTANSATTASTATNATYATSAGSISGYNNPTTTATANTIVYRDANAHIVGNYILGTYFNASAGNSENPTIGQIWTQNTGDNYLRKSTPAHFISQLGLLTTSNYTSYAPSLTGSGASGTWSINVTGSAGSASSASSLSLGSGSITSNAWAGGGGYHGYSYSGGNFRFGFSSTAGVVDVYADGNFYATDSSYLVLHTGNYSSYVVPKSGGAFTGNVDLTATSYAYGLGSTAGSTSTGLQIYSHSGYGAIMSFHRGGYYAVNMGLDSDNVMRIGGWSAGANRWQLDMSGNETLAGSSYAYAFYGTSNVAGTGSASYHPSGIYSTGNNWLYGTIYQNGNILYTGRVYGPWDSSSRNYSREWIQFDNYTALYSPLNGAHFYPNNASYGAWKIDGSRNGWGGLEFSFGSNGNTSLMLGSTSNETGFHNNSYGWQFRWSNGTLYIHKGAYGGGSEAWAIDTSNYTNWIVPKAGGAFDGNVRWYGGTSDGSNDAQIFLTGGGGFTIASIQTSMETGFQGGGGNSYRGTGAMFTYDKRLYVWQDVVQYYSDERLKEKVGVLDGALKAITTWTPFKYRDNDLAKSFNLYNDRVQIGLSAQEVETSFPELVERAPFDTETDTSDVTNPRRYSKSGQEYLTLNYHRLVPVLVQAIKELEARVAQLEA